MLALESRLGEQIRLDMPILFWMVEYASELINRCKVQVRDGETSFERKFGKKDVLALAEFGEAVHHKPLGQTPPGESLHQAAGG